ncbi:hypothetical protein EDB89DRAFT_70061 [Lactarius sanguifluus]|nr:hypothetical protein EDB89DRAFT_70061 [Lactarius sanguifluus]
MVYQRVKVEKVMIPAARKRGTSMYGCSHKARAFPSLRALWLLTLDIFLGASSFPSRFRLMDSMGRNLGNGCRLRLTTPSRARMFSAFAKTTHLGMCPVLAATLFETRITLSTTVPDTPKTIYLQQSYPPRSPQSTHSIRFPILSTHGTPPKIL